MNPRLRPHLTILVLTLVVCALYPSATRAYDNLLPTPSFERDSDGDGAADGWQREIHEGAEGSFALTPAHAVHGEHSQHIVHANESPAWVRMSRVDIPARPDALYALDGWIKAEGSWQVLLYEFPAEGEYLTHHIASGGATDWRRVSGSVRTTPGARTFKVSLITMGRGEAWFDRFSLLCLDERPDLRIPQLPAAPAVDGVLEEEAWQTAAAIDALYVLGGGGETARPPVRVYLGFHDRTLYVGWHCDEPDAALLVVGEPPRWDHDTVELFIGRAADRDGYSQFGVTPNGGLLQTHRLAGGYAVDWYSTATTALGDRTVPWRGAAARGERVWTAEMAVPMETIGGVPRPGEAFRLQLARSRKIGDIDANSCWAYTPAETFHAPEFFGRAVFLCTAATPPPSVRAPAFVPDPIPQLVPMPRRLHTPGTPPQRLPAIVSVSIHGDDRSQPAARLLTQLIEARTTCTLRWLPWHEREHARLVLGPPAAGGRCARAWEGIARASLTPWQTEEAYGLDTTTEPAVLAAPHPRGLVYAVHTLRQLLVSDGSDTWLRAAAMTDWPAVRWRGWHLISPERGQFIPEAKRVIDTLAALKMNWIALQIDNRLQYTVHADLSREAAPTKAQLRDLVAHAEGHLMEVIPMTQCWSHFNYFLTKPAFRHLAEVQQPAAEARHTYWNYCPRHPETHPLLFAMIDEQLECFPHARYYHAGLDEITFEPIGVCDRCRGAGGGELLAEEIERLHGFLKERNLRMCMWGDQLLADHNGGAPHNTAAALPRIPRDVIIFDWHYAPATVFPSLRFFSSNGFDVVASGWYEPLNVVPFSTAAARLGILGYGGTTWYAIHRIRAEVRLMTAMPLAAENAWSTGTPTIADIPYRPAEWFQRLYDDPAPRPVLFHPISLAQHANRTLGDDRRRQGWMGQGPDYDLANLPTGRQWFAGIPFDIPAADDLQCIVLANDEDVESAFTKRAWQIPVNAAARSLAFLHTCSRPERFSRHIYDRADVNPRTVARYVIHYDSGNTEEVALEWNLHIADWNSQLGSAYGRTAWRGTTRAGALARTEVFRWTNPHPDDAITAVDMISGETTVRPALIALTAIR